MFACVPPVPEAFIAALGDRLINRFGADNVVLWNSKNVALVDALNPWENVHAFHQHSDAQAKGSGAYHSVGSEVERREEFGATKRFEFLSPAERSGSGARGSKLHACWERGRGDGEEGGGVECAQTWRC